MINIALIIINIIVTNTTANVTNNRNNKRKNNIIISIINASGIHMVYNTPQHICNLLSESDNSSIHFLVQGNIAP